MSSFHFFGFYGMQVIVENIVHIKVNIFEKRCKSTQVSVGLENIVGYILMAQLGSCNDNIWFSVENSIYGSTCTSS
jgi:hypothetical protein